MKLITPDIVYHNIQPIYSCDIQPKSGDFIRLATGGLDNAVRLWKVQFEFPSQDASSNIELVSNLCRHEKEVNAVRWSPSGKILASASSDGVIILWQRNEGKYEQNNDIEDGESNLEVWSPRFLRRHIQDVYDICWSSDDKHIISGSIDCTAILWNVSNNKSMMLKDHKQFVQGVAWDPLDNFVVTQSADRTFRVYRATSINCIYKVWKAGDVKLFQDGSWKFFFRRLQFSPDGKLLVAPAGTYNAQKENVATDDFHAAFSNNDEHCAHIFIRNNLSKVAVTIPTGKNPVIGVRFNPVRFTLRKSEQSVFKLPYRWIFCLVLDTAILVFDTEQCLPILKVTNIHCVTINDASWSPDGHCLVVCSTDGYCSYMSFDKGELGEPFALASNQPRIRPMEFEDVEGHEKHAHYSADRSTGKVVDMAMESTEILPMEDNEDESCSDTDECSVDQDAVVAEKVIVAEPAVHLVIPAKRRLTLTTLKDSDMISEEPKEKKRRITFTTLI